MGIFTPAAGEIGHYRGALFEKTARTIITEGLHLTSNDIPVSPNYPHSVGNTNYGDVDFAFVCDRLLVNLDMKSWQRSVKNFQGEPQAVKQRIQRLVKHLNQKVEPRGKQLLAYLNSQRSSHLLGVCSFLCVATIEWLSPREPELWYGELPRVITPTEIVEAFRKAETRDGIVRFAST